MSESRRIRIMLRRPEAVAVVEDLAATPHEFDSLFPRSYYAHQLKLAGHDWPTIARKLDYTSALAAESAVHRWLYTTRESRRGQFAESKAEMHADAVAGELERLDKLQAAYWEDAIGGDIPSALFCLRVIAQRAKLLGLEQVQTQVTTTLNTLVVGGSEAEYVQALLRAKASVGPAQVIDSGDQTAVVD